MFRAAFGSRPSRIELPDDVEDYQCFTDALLKPRDLGCEPISSQLYNRECGLPGSYSYWSSSRLVPSTCIPPTLEFDSRVYNGQFSCTGDLYYCTSQGDIKVFDTSDPSDWSLLKTIDGIGIQWTITDADISPCQKYIIYSTFNSNIYLANITPDSENVYQISMPQINEQIAINTSARNDYAVFSLKFSGEGNKVVVGTNGFSLEVIDLVKKKNVCSVPNAHQDDVNTVCFADREGSNVIFSGSDDTAVKIWDVRAMGGRDSQGVLIGHREGITHVSSKGDEIYLISNSKDQTLKLWDLRKCSNKQEYKTFRRTHHYQSGFDYRWNRYPMEGYTKRLAADTSLLTFRGHHVLTTLIRCYFSPIFTTGQRFIYSGDYNGQVYVYDAYTGKTVNVLRSLTHEQMLAGETCSRDVSWHPFMPMICATSFLNTIHTYTYDSDE